MKTESNVRPFYGKRSRVIECDVAIVGAGPYGLSTAAHLKRIAGLDVRIFGEPMDFWRSQVPEGMLLRSPWTASNLSDPDGVLDLDSFCAETMTRIPTPIPLDQFVEYGLWFQRKAVRDVDTRCVMRIETDSHGFRVTLVDGDSFIANRVVVATGIAPFAYRPSQFQLAPRELVSHSSDKRDIQRFRGKRVLVVGAGQSALESAALIQEVGGQAEVIARTPQIHWLGWRAKLQRLGPIAKLLYSPYDVGPAGVSRIVAVPGLVKLLPRGVQDRFRVRSLRPAGARWLRERMANIPITTGCSVLSATCAGNEVRITLDNGQTRCADHVLLGTGYRVNVSQYKFLTPDLSRRLDQVDGFPKLSKGFESSVAGLHFLGAPSAWTFGPLMYFVAGADYAARSVAQFVNNSRPRASKPLHVT